MTKTVRELEAELAQANKRLVEDAKRAAIGMALARAQVKDPNRVYETIASQVLQDNFGRWVVGENGVAKVGPDEDATYSIDRLVADVTGKSSTDTASKRNAGGLANPFVRGPHWNLTEQAIMMRSDPEKAEYLQHLAGLGK